MGEYRTVDVGLVRAVQWQPFVSSTLPPGVHERKRSWLDRLLRRPCDVDRTWYVLTPHGKSWLSAGEWIVSVLGTYEKYVISDDMFCAIFYSATK